MRILLMLSILLAGQALGEPRPAPYLEPQAFLAGNCWKGTFPDGKRTDEHCFEWIYGGQYLRDRHVVAGGPAPYGGETIYFFDAASKTVQYLYINTLGGASRRQCRGAGRRARVPGGEVQRWEAGADLSQLLAAGGRRRVLRADRSQERQ